MNETKTNLTLKQRQRLQGKASPASKPSGGPTNAKELSRKVAILLLLLAFGVGTALGMIYFRPDPQLQEMADMEAIMGDPNTPWEVRRELGQVVEDDIPANLRRGRGMRGDPEERDMARAPKFLAMSPADQLAEAQKDAARQKEREAMQAAREAAAAANPAANPASSSQANGNGNNNGGGRGGSSDQQRVQRKEQGLANHPPQARAQGTLMRQMMNAVKQQASVAH